MLRTIVSRLPTQQHADTWLELDKLRVVLPYRKTFRFPGRHVRRFHKALADAPDGRMGLAGLIDIGVDGYLWKPEAMKLYEIAYFTRGDVLELGTFRGLSTSIIAHALHDRGSGTLITCDLDPASTAASRANIAHLPGGDRIEFRSGDGTACMDSLIAAGRRFGMIFVDHWHGYDATREAALRAEQLISPGGFVLFHDYTDGHSADPSHPNKVYQGVRDTIAQSKNFRFSQICASMGVFEQVTSAERSNRAHDWRGVAGAAGQD